MTRSRPRPQRNGAPHAAASSFKGVTGLKVHRIIHKDATYRFKVLVPET